MQNHIFNSGIKKDGDFIDVILLLIHFTDENDIHFIYSPHLDLTGYGDSLEAAKKSFEIAFNDFIEYTIEENTLGKVLTKLGWKHKGKFKKTNQITAPGIAILIQENDYIAEIFDKYQAHTFHEEVNIPAVSA